MTKFDLFQALLLSALLQTPGLANVKNPHNGGCGITVPTGCTVRNDYVLSCFGNSEDHRHPGHAPSGTVSINSQSSTDSGGWLYHNDRSDPQFGTVQANCTHEDIRGIPWLTY